MARHKRRREASPPPAPPAATLLSLPSDVLRLIADALYGSHSNGCKRSWLSLSATCRVLRAECFGGLATLRLPLAFPSALHTALHGERIRVRGYHGARALTVDALDDDGNPPPQPPSDEESCDDEEDSDEDKPPVPPAADPRLHLTPRRCAAMATAVTSLGRWIPRVAATGVPITGLRIGEGFEDSQATGLDAAVYGQLMPSLVDLPLKSLEVSNAALGVMLHRPFPRARLVDLYACVPLDDPTAGLALSYLLATHGSTLKVLRLGYSRRVTSGDAPTGFLAAWLAGARSAPRPPPPPPPLSSLSPPPPHAPPTLLPALHTLRWTGPVNAADVAALVAACPGLVTLSLSGVLWPGCMVPAAVAGGALPALRTVSLSSRGARGHTLWADVPHLLAGRSLDSLSFDMSPAYVPPGAAGVARAQDWVIDAVRTSASLPRRLVISPTGHVRNSVAPFVFGDAAVRRLVGADDPPLPAADPGDSPYVGPRPPPRPCVDPTLVADLTIGLAAHASWAAIRCLAGFPRLAKLFLNLSAARLGPAADAGWPPFPALTDLTLSWDLCELGTLRTFFRGLLPPPSMAGGAGRADGAGGTAAPSPDGCGDRPLGWRAPRPRPLRLTLVDDSFLGGGVALLRRQDVATAAAVWGRDLRLLTIKRGISGRDGWEAADAVGGGGGPPPPDPNDDEALVGGAVLRAWVEIELPGVVVMYGGMR